jgi:hypothetical protein
MMSWSGWLYPSSPPLAWRAAPPLAWRAAPPPRLASCARPGPSIPSAPGPAPQAWAHDLSNSGPPAPARLANGQPWAAAASPGLAHTWRNHTVLPLLWDWPAAAPHGVPSNTEILALKRYKRSQLEVGATEQQGRQTVFFPRPQPEAM